jgi:hypothetical protein
MSGGLRPYGRGRSRVNQTGNFATIVVAPMRFTAALYSCRNIALSLMLLILGIEEQGEFRDFPAPRLFQSVSHREKR